MSSINLFFIVGRGRSGTDLIQRLLNTNNNICIPPESTVLPLLYKKYKASKKWNQKTINSFVKNSFLDEKLPIWWNLKQTKTKDYLLEKKPSNFREAIYFLYEFYAIKNNKNNVIIGDKNPASSLYINEILEIFPSAKFIAVVRNPIDNVFSFTNVSFDSNNPEILAHRWNYYNKQILKSIKNKPSQFHIVRFEDVIENPEKILSGITQYLNIENSFNLDKKEKGVQVWQKNLDNKISSEHINKGIKGLKKSDVINICSICSSTANEYGYEIESSKNSNSNIIAWFFNRFEKHFIRLPLYLSSAILKFYRRKSKIIVKKDEN